MYLSIYWFIYFAYSFDAINKVMDQIKANDKQKVRMFRTGGRKTHVPQNDSCIGNTGNKVGVGVKSGSIHSSFLTYAFTRRRYVPTQHWIFKWCDIFHFIQGIARTQSPTNINYAPESPTFGVIAEVNPPGVQWTGLALGEPPLGSRCPLCQVSMLEWERWANPHSATRPKWQCLVLKKVIWQQKLQSIEATLWLFKMAFIVWKNSFFLCYNVHPKPLLYL